MAENDDLTQHIARARQDPDYYLQSGSENWNLALRHPQLMQFLAETYPKVLGQRGYSQHWMSKPYADSLLDRMAKDVQPLIWITGYWGEKKVGEKRLNAAAQADPYGVLKELPEMRRGFDGLLDEEKPTPWMNRLKGIALKSENLARQAGANADVVLANLKMFSASPHYKSVLQAAAVEDSTGLGVFSNLPEIRKVLPPTQVAAIEKRAAEILSAQLSTDRFKALDAVRTINNLHEQPDEIRFKLLENLSSHQLYNLVLDGRKEIYTSSFNGLLDRMLLKLKAEGKTFLDLAEQEQKKENLPVFFEAATSYGRIEDIFKSLPHDGDRKKLLQGIFASIDDSLNDPGVAWNENMRSAVALADTMKTLKSKDLRGAFEESLVSNFADATNPKAKTAYGLIASAYLKNYSANAEHPDLFTQYPFEQDYPLQTKTALSPKELFDDKGRHVQQMIFYGDTDGHSSYENFLNQYSKRDKKGARQALPGWSLEERGAFAIVRGLSSDKQRSLILVANRPGDEKDKSDLKNAEAAGQYLKDNAMEPSFIIHRGHSTHVEKTMPYIHEKTAAVFWGSCGGNQNITDTLDRAPDAHPLSTSGTGTMAVNDPLFKFLNEKILNLKNNNLEWSKVWPEAAAKIKDPRFEQYISPESNFSVVFAQSYETILKRERDPNYIPADELKKMEELEKRAGLDPTRDGRGYSAIDYPSLGALHGARPELPSRQEAARTELPTPPPETPSSATASSPKTDDKLAKADEKPDTKKSQPVPASV